MVPARGVYVTETMVPSGRRVTSITNVGLAPTLRKTDSGLRLETHLLEEGDWSIYNEKIRVNFCCRLRDEMKFPAIQDLKDQIEKDVREAREYWHKTKVKKSGPKSP